MAYYGSDPACGNARTPPKAGASIKHVPTVQANLELAAGLTGQGYRDRSLVAITLPKWNENTWMVLDPVLQPRWYQFSHRGGPVVAVLCCLVARNK
jgi:hypothetical protein